MSTSSFEDFRKGEHASAKDQNNAKCIAALLLAKTFIDALSFEECTEENCKKALKKAKVPKGTITKLENSGHIRDMADSRGISIIHLCKDTQKINALSIDPTKQSIDEKSQTQFWNENNTDGLTINPLPNTGPRLVRKTMESCSVENAFNSSVKHLFSFLPNRLGGAGRAAGEVARQRDSLLSRLDRTITTIDTKGNEDRFNCSSSFDGELIDEHGSFRGYAILKFQNPCRGGAQDRQKDDVHNTVRMCADYIRTNPDEKDTIFYFIMDGGGLVPHFLDELQRHVDQEGIGDRVFVKTNSV